MNFVIRSGSQLMLDGQPFRASGKNLYFLQMEYAFAQGAAEPNLGLARLRTVLDETARTPFQVIRTCGFNAQAKYHGTIQEGPYAYRESGLSALDQAIAEAKERGLRIILVLANNWADLGGLDRYAAWAGKSHDDFFSNAEMQAWYQDYASMLARRVNTFTGIAYRDEPALLAIEIANELRCSSCRGTQRLQETVATLARHLKQVFPNHLIADGGEGFDDNASLYPGLSHPYAVSGGEGASFSKLCDIPELDLVSHHFYPLAWRLHPSRDAEVWIDRHQALAEVAGKVAYLGEYGLDQEDAQRAPVYEAWLQRYFSHHRGALGLYWPLHVSGAEGPPGKDTFFREDPLTQSVLSRWGQALR